MTTPTPSSLTVAPAVLLTTDDPTGTDRQQRSRAVDAAVTAFIELAHEGVSTSVLAATFELDEATVRDLLGRRDLSAPGRAA